MASLAPHPCCVKWRPTHVMGDGSGNETRPLLVDMGLKLLKY